MHSIFSVIRHGDGWGIISGRNRWGRFRYQVDAEEAALRLAQDAIAVGMTAEVLVQTQWGEMTRLNVA